MKNLSLYIIIVALLSLCACSAPEPTDTDKASADLFAMNTYMSITAYGTNADIAVSSIEKYIYEMDRKWSVTNPESEIILLNSQKQAALSVDTKEILERSAALHNLTSGAFNITTFPIVKLWGFTTSSYQIPASQDIEAALPYLDSSAVKINGNTASITNAHTELDLGAIAKGYVTDKAKDILVENGVASAIVSLGGNIYAHGTRVDGEPWRVGVQDPLDADKKLGYIEAIDLAVITSGSYERFFEADGKLYHHIIDPETGFPADNGLVSVTIVCDNATTADALSTATFVMGMEKSVAFWQESGKYFGIIFVTEDGKIFITENIASKFHSIDKKTEISIIN